ncbi:MAG: dephospho-CoA kinase [Alphaproteobacteria bacterium]|nr:dephospho-CoA kinase [Alphaproteobacteria bacterium]
MLVVGLTGLIGSGKSLVASVFKSIGIPVFSSDEEAKIIMLQPEIRNAMVEYFGEESYCQNQLNRIFIANKIYSNSNHLEFVNKLVHPATAKVFQKWKSKHTTKYVIKETAILFESIASQDIDKSIGVFCPQDLCLARIIKRNQLTSAEAQARIKNQIDPNIKMKLCDFVIDNSEQVLILPQILAIHNQLLTMGS